jgi:hypothetical protein
MADIIGKTLYREQIPGEDSSNPIDAIVHDSGNAIAINYAPYLERIATALEAQKIAIEEIRDVVKNPSGIPIKDIYASFSYSALVKLYQEEGRDINDLIARTKQILDNL